jgi:sulfide:quinone oxidoreductase
MRVSPDAGRSSARHAPNMTDIGPRSSRRQGREPRARVVIAGGGVAAVEAILALRELAGHGVAIDLIAPENALADRPSSVAVPFGLGTHAPLDLLDLAWRHDVTVHRGELDSVNAAARLARLPRGAEVPYDFLLVAVGARPVQAVPGATTFRGPADVGAIERLLDEAAEGRCGRIAVAVPAGATWPLPAYELAIMAAIDLRDRGADQVELTVVTPERDPLWLFGAAAGNALREMLSARGIGLRTGARPATVHEGRLTLESGEVLPTDAVVALPALEGPGVPGIAHDAAGFLPTDAHGRVAGVDRVLAAGDATTFPIKQGGLATQQADAAAATIAAAVGAIDHAAPFSPVLRGLLLTGGAPLYLRAELGPSGTPRTTAGPRRLRGETSGRALWWPPGKIAGRYLAPYLATARRHPLGSEPLVDRVARPAQSDEPERAAALELAVLLADEDAAAGDLGQALQALDAAAALCGGILPPEYSDRRERWRAQLARRTSEDCGLPISAGNYGAAGRGETG